MMKQFSTLPPGSTNISNMHCLSQAASFATHYRSDDMLTVHNNNIVVYHLIAHAYCTFQLE